jgi:hypothetical protein
MMFYNPYRLHSTLGLINVKDTTQQT